MNTLLLHTKKTAALSLSILIALTSFIAIQSLD